MKRFFVALQLISCATSCCSAARILAFVPFPSISRFNIISTVTNELARRGHDVVFFTTLSELKPQPNVTYVTINCTFQATTEASPPCLGSMVSPLSLIMFMNRVTAPLTENVMKSDPVQHLVHYSSEKFDVVIHEAFFCQEIAAVLAHRFNALSVPILGMGDDSWANEHAGLPDNPAYMVSWLSRSTDQMTFSERLFAVLTLTTTTLLKYYYLNQMETLAGRHLNYPGWESRPPLRRLLSDNALILVNSHHSLGYNYPKAPHVKEIGGVHILPPKPLPEDIEKFLDESKEGFILFSLGSVINTGKEMVSNTKDELVKALSSMSYRVLCKFQDDTIKMPENIKTLKWVPQNDVLAHKNVRLFISHGGLQSTFEALHHGVPMLVLPFFTDQFKNAKLVERAGYGITLDPSTADHSSIIAAVNELLENPRYKEKARIQSALLRDRPMHPLNESIYWIEYVLRHGRSLQPSSVRLSFIQLHLLDVLGASLLGWVACYYVLKRSFRFVMNFWRSNPREKEGGGMKND